MTPPRVSIITINYRQAAMTCELLESLRQISYPNFEVIVVDNGSDFADVQLIEARHPWVRVICNGSNEGFTGGNNAGIRVAEGDYVLLLNNDTVVEQRFLEPLVESLESDPSAGIASPKIHYFDPPQVIQYAGASPINPLTARGRMFGNLETDRGQYDQPEYTNLAHGAAMLIGRRVLQEIGLLADVFFIYYEELDFCERAKRAGHRIRYVPSSVVRHKESATTGSESPFKTFYQTRNRLLYVRRNLAGMRRLAASLFIVCGAFPKSLLQQAMRGRIDLAAALCRGLFWHAGRRDVHANDYLSAAGSAS